MSSKIRCSQEVWVIGNHVSPFLLILTAPMQCLASFAFYHVITKGQNYWMLIGQWRGHFFFFVLALVWSRAKNTSSWLPECTAFTFSWFLHFEKNNFIFFEVGLLIRVAFAKKGIKLKISITCVFRSGWTCPRRCLTRAISVTSEKMCDMINFYLGPMWLPIQTKWRRMWNKRGDTFVDETVFKEVSVVRKVQARTTKWKSTPAVKLRALMETTMNIPKKGEEFSKKVKVKCLEMQLQAIESQRL